MKMNTFSYYAPANISSDTNMSPVDCRNTSGYSVGVELTNAVGLNCVVKLECSASKFGGPTIWATIPESELTIKDNEVVNYNVSECYYAQFRIVIDIKSGSADVEAVVTTKAY